MVAIFAGALVVACLVGCGQAPDRTPAASSASDFEPSSAPPAIDGRSIAEWTRFRRSYGLRSDREWVLEVARDANALHDLTVPLMPAELDLVSARNLSVQALASQVITYGEAFPQEYSGAFIDSTRITVQFTDRIERHRASLNALFGESAPIDVRAVEYSLSELEELARNVKAESEWFTTIGAELHSASPREQTNSVRVRYKASNEEIEPQILDHFGNPDWMALSRYGPLPWSGPWGSLRVEVVDQAGRPAGVTCALFNSDRSVPSDYLPLSADDGVCRYDRLPAVVWDVQISYERRDGADTSVIEPVRVRADGPTVHRAVVER